MTTQAEVTICSNTETLRPIWGDVWSEAGWTDTHDIDEEIATIWCKSVANALGALGIEYKYESSFSAWHGGSARQYNGTDTRVDAVFKAADRAAIQAARDEVEQVAAAMAEEVS